MLYCPIEMGMLSCKEHQKLRDLGEVPYKGPIVVGHAKEATDPWDVIRSLHPGNGCNLVWVHLKPFSADRIA